MGDTGKRRRLHQALSAVFVRTVTKPGNYADGDCLYLVVDEKGKRWVLRTNIHNKRSEIGLGSASLVSLADAREKGFTFRKIARTGGDPLDERRRQQRERKKERIESQIPTFKNAAHKVHRSLSKSFRNPKHADQWITSLETHVFPVFGDRRIDGVGSADVLTALEEIWLKIPETARRVRQRIRLVFDWAKAKSYRSGDNPVDGVSKVLPKQTTTVKHHAALAYTNLPVFIDELRENAKSAMSVKLAFEFLILTAARTGEVLNARKSEIDLKTKTWTVPANRMKAKVEHKVPLSPRCLEILARAEELSAETEYIFPGRSPKRPLSDMSFEMTLRRMNRSNITPHGFRSTFRDWAEERTNFSNNVIEAALAHTVKNKVEAAYLRTKLFEKRQKLMDTWALFATTKSAKVVRIHA